MRCHGRVMHEDLEDENCNAGDVDQDVDGTWVNKMADEDDTPTLLLLLLIPITASLCPTFAA